MIETNHNKQHFSKLILFLPNIYNIKLEIIEELFCRNLHEFKNVYELLNAKLEKIILNNNNSNDLSNNNNNLISRITEDIISTTPTTQQDQ